MLKFFILRKCKIEERHSQLQFTQLKQAAKRKPEKYSGLNGIRTHDLCDAGAVLNQLSYQASWELVMLWLDSSVGRALHRHRRGHGFECRSSLIFFRLSFRYCLNNRPLSSRPASRARGARLEGLFSFHSRLALRTRLN